MASLKDTLQQIDDQIRKLQSLLPLKPEDQLKLDKKFRLEFNYNSNHIEGNTLTYGETELLILRDETKGDHEFREYEEMKGHDVALKMIQQEAKDVERPLTEQFIRLLNEKLLVRPFWKEAITQDGQPTRKEIIPGQYKTTPNSVRLQNGEIFQYASPDDTKIEMPELVAWYNENNTKEHPLLLAAMLHYRFVKIHPFDDGNGRIARLLMNYVLLRNHLPLIVIKSDEKDKKAYLSSLNRADIGEIDFFVNYIGEQLLWSLQLNIKAAMGEDLEEPDDLDKKIAILSRKITSDKKNIQKKTPDILIDLFEESLSLLINKIYNSVEKFLKFYEHITWRFVWDPAHDYDELKNFYEALHQSFLFRQMSFQSIIIEYHLKGFKADVTKNIEFFERFEVRFEEFRYSIKLGHSFEKHYPYDYRFTDTEINDILHLIATQLYTDTEQKMEQGK